MNRSWNGAWWFVFLVLGLSGCWLDRVFNPVEDPGPIVAVEPKFSYLEPGQSVELQARFLDGTAGNFTFSEDSGGQTVSLEPLDGRRVLVRGVGPGQARVFADSGDDQGVAIVTVTEGNGRHAGGP